MTQVKRSEWGAAPPRKTATLNSPRGVAIHWVGVPVIGDPYKFTKSIQRYHQETRGWWDIAYNQVCADGVSFEGRGWSNRSGANGSGRTNRSHAAICVLIGPGQKVKDGHIDAVRTSIAAMRRDHPRALEIVGHRDLKKSTTCPGDELAALIADDAFEPGQPVLGKPPTPLPSSGYPVPTFTLRRGARGDEVAWLQYQLGRHGYTCAIDGAMGPKTVRQLTKYQRDHGLLADGIAGPQTTSYLIGAAL